MKLGELIKDIDGCELHGSSDVDVCDLAYNASGVVPGGCFIAMRGAVADGHSFVKEAISRGAAVIVSEHPLEVAGGVASVVCMDVRRVMASMSARLFGDPSRSLTLIGVTGTNGKTTTTYLLEAVLFAAGRRPGVIGTVSYRFAGGEQAALHTTPQSVDLQRMLGRMREAGCDSCALEVSSHALVQGRVGGCHFDCAVFTNLSQEHLDYHGEMESYFSAKAILFETILASSAKADVFAVIGRDDAYGRELISRCPVRTISYGFSDASDVRGEGLRSDGGGIGMRVITPAGSLDCRSGLRGRFNAQNILAAIAVSAGLGISLDVVDGAIRRVGAVPGRFEVVPNRKGVLALVDYAHTPDALENILVNARDMVERDGGRLICVFGCGGDRDRKKRPLMGGAAARLADIVIITSDNPRGEDPLSIIDEVMPGVRGAASPLEHGKGYEAIPDRREAIGRAVGLSRPGDVIVVAGKGHENYQIVNSRRLHFDDREVLKECLSADR